MKLYFAPLEGITTYTYRNTHRELFGEADAYFAPFINPSDLEKVSRKGMRDILPDNNENINLKVQVLTSNAEAFLRFEEKIKKLGYRNININIGCPASTVVGKGRGAGFLRDVGGMDDFFKAVFEKTELSVSVKTRIGYSSPDEFESILEVYKKYPISSLIVHPRTREQLYNGSVDYEAFRKAYSEAWTELVYNGDVVRCEGFDAIKSQFPDIGGVMIGRGAVRNPAIFREIKGGAPLQTEELCDFSRLLAERYKKVLGSEVFTLHKLKEIWVYIMQSFPSEKKIGKTIKKSSTLDDFFSAIRNLPKL